MPWGHSSYLIASLSPSSANLLAAYPPLKGVTILPSTELTLMMVPPPAAVIEGRTALDHSKGPEEVGLELGLQLLHGEALYRSP